MFRTKIKRLIQSRFIFLGENKREMSLQEFQEAIQCIQKGDMAGLGTIYQEYFEHIYTIALKSVKDRQDAYDLAMEVIIKLCKYRGNAEEIKNHIGFIVTVTRNAIKDYFRHKAFIVANGEQITNNTEATAKGDDLWLLDIICALSEEEKEVLIQHVCMGISLRDIACKTNRAYISVRRIYASTKEKIRIHFFNELRGIE